MKFAIGIENNFENRSLAWVLGHPGCFVYGPNSDSALAAAPQAILDYSAWIASRNRGESWVDTNRIELVLTDTWEVYTIDERFNLAVEGYEVNAWFLDDWKPLTVEDVERAAQLLAWSRMDLLEAVYGLSPEAMNADHPGEWWSIAGILNHIDGGEQWYLDRLGLVFPRQHLAKDPFERLSETRAQLVDALPALVGSTQVVGVEGEFWSPRKLLRRALWHERDHTAHILRLRVADE
jgi:uncharacterized damage-inducible protein DinB